MASGPDLVRVLVAVFGCAGPDGLEREVSSDYVIDGNMVTDTLLDTKPTAPTGLAPGVVEPNTRTGYGDMRPDGEVADASGRSAA